MHSIEAINNSTTQSASMHAAHPESSEFIGKLLNREIQLSIGHRSAISVECNNGVVTLNGYFANKHDRNTALHAAIINSSVSKVINNAN